jgi:hypothetical protein
MGDMIRQMALAIADAQVALDEAGVETAQIMSGQPVTTTDEDGSEVTRETTVLFGKDAEGNPQQLSMIELGFTPTFYQFVDNLIEVKIAIKMTRERSFENRIKGKRTTVSLSRRGFRVSTTPVDATYSSKYNYSAEGSSLLRSKLVPVPPPAILEERIRELMDEEEA